MLKGFYNLTSGVLTHQRNLNVIANNMVNISTPGYKQDRYTATTFDEVMYSRVGNKDSMGPEIGKQSYIRATSDVVTDFSQGVLEPTGHPMDFAIQGEGFFGIENEAGQIVYTRGGSFTMDEDGYLCCPGVGFVLDPGGNRIKLTTDQIYAQKNGFIYSDKGELQGQIGVFAFAGNENLERNEQGFFVGGDVTPSENAELLNGYVERSNTDVVKQMTEMVTYQRSLQSAAQAMKMYDSLMSKTANDVGRL